MRVTAGGQSQRATMGGNRCGTEPDPATAPMVDAGLKAHGTVRPGVTTGTLTEKQCTRWPKRTRLPVDIDAQPWCRRRLRCSLRCAKYHDEIEGEQRMPPALFEQLRAAGFYKMVIPRSLGGLQVDPLTYLRVVELLAEGAGSVGWNLGNGASASWSRSGCRTRASTKIYGKRADTVIAGTAVPGGGKAVPVAGGLPGQRSVAVRQRLPRGQLDAGELSGDRR